jgi:hypothetical protein
VAKAKKPRKYEHDSKTCFRCRLHELYVELAFKHDNSPNFVLLALAEASGQLLNEMGVNEFMLFMQAVAHFASDNDSHQTRH